VPRSEERKEDEDEDEDEDEGEDEDEDEDEDEEEEDEEESRGRRVWLRVKRVWVWWYPRFLCVVQYSTVHL
jgi:hypothetical protein